MRRTGLSFLALLVPLAVAAGPARADTIELISTDGPLRLHIDGSGDVHGSYPKREGELFGHVGPDGDIHGIWVQPRSDHPCNEARRGTNSWGVFLISNPYHRNIAGYWGYCGEQPRRDWQMQHR